MRSTPFIASDLYPQLGIGVVVLIVLAAFLVYRTVKSSTEPDQATPQHSTEPLLAPAMSPEATAMLEKFESDEILALLDLVSAMAGYGPTVDHDRFRTVAAQQMGYEVYRRFTRALLAVAQLPESAVISQRTIIELSNYPEEHLLMDDGLLTFLVTNAKPMSDFYMQFCTDRDLTDGLPPFSAMIDHLDELIGLNGKFYG